MPPDRDLGTINPSELLKKKELVIPPNILIFIKSMSEENLLKIVTYIKPKVDVKTLPAKKKLEVVTNINLKDLIVSSEPEVEALSALRLAWIFSLTGEGGYNRKKREVDLYRIHRNWPEQISSLNSIDTFEIDEISHLVREANTPRI